MKKTFLLFFLIFGFSFATAQTNLDSLYGIWKDKTQTDSSRIRALDDYIWFGYVYSQPDSAIVLTDTLFEFSRHRGFKKDMATALNMKAVTYFVKGDYIMSLKYHDQSLKIRKEIGDKKGIASSLNNIGNIYKTRGEYVKALDYQQKSFKIFDKIGDKSGIANNYLNIGLLYLDQGYYIKALEYYQKSLKIFKEIADKRGIASSLNNIGITYENQGDNTKALEYYKRSLKIREENGDITGISGSLTNIGIIYYNMGDYPRALNYQKRSLKISEEMGNKRGIAISLNSMGESNLKQGNNLNAITYCEKGFNFALEIGSIAWQKELCSCLYNAYKAIGNGNKALAYHEQMLVLIDSLQTEETVKKLQQMEFAKQVLADSLLQVEKNLKIEMAHQTEVRKKDKNKNIALGAGIFFLLLSGGLYGRWRYVKKSKAIIEKEKARSENLLLNILPAEIAEELKLKGCADARDFDMVSILFTDFKGFTLAAEKLSAKVLIEEINHCFMAFDHICEKHGIEKIKTIGDAYMAAGGLPIPSDDAVKNIVLAALDMQSFITNRIIEKQAKNEIPFKMRLGIHTGPVVAGIVGIKKFQYDIWGDTVNTASRMESSGEIGKVNISQETYKLIKNDPQFSFEARGKIQAKNKGEIEMLFVTKASY